MKSYTRWFSLLCLLLAAGPMAMAQNMTDDIINNNFDGLKKKVLLLSPNFKDAPYLDLYLTNARVLRNDMLDYLIAQGADINQVDANGFGPLYYAIQQDWDYGFEKLLSLKADPNTKWKTAPSTVLGYGFYSQVSKKDVFQLTPLAAAVRAGRTGMTQRLLELGADPLAELVRYTDSSKKTTVLRTVFDDVVETFSTASLPSPSAGFSSRPLDVKAFAAGNLVWKAVLKLPAKKQPKVASEKSKNIFAAFAAGDMKAFKTELGRTGDNTLAFLPYAAEGKNWEVIDLLYQYNSLEIDSPVLADPSAGISFFGGDEPKKIPLLAWVLTNGSVEAAQFLVDHGAKLPETVSFQLRDQSWESSPWPTDYNSQSPLIFAVQSDNGYLLQFLLDQKLDANKVQAIRYCRSDWTRAILANAGADLTITATPGKDGPAIDLLFDAAARGDAEAAAFFLANGIDPNRSLDASPLLAAVAHTQPALVSLLLKAGAKRDATVTKGALYQLRGLDGADALKVAQVLADNTWGDKGRFNEVLTALQKN